MKRTLLGVAVLAALIVGVLAIGPSLIDWNRFKGRIADEAQAVLGRELVIKGDLSLRLLPQPTLTVEGVSLANKPGAGAQEMASLARAEVRLGLLALLGGRFEVRSLVLIRPVLRLERLADGSTNWAFGEGAQGPEGAKSEGPNSEGNRAGAGVVSLADVRVQDGTIIYRDLRAGIVRRAEAVEGRLSAQSLNGPFRAQGSARALGLPLTFQIAAEALAPGRASPVSFALGLAESRLEFSGVIAGYPDRLRINGQVGFETPDISAAIADISGAPAAEGAARVAGKLQGSIEASADGLSIEDLRLSVGESETRGKVVLDLAGEDEEGEAALTVSFGNVDLDTLLVLARASRGENGAGGGNRVGGGGDPSPFDFLSESKARIEANVDSILFRGAAFAGVTLSARLAGGEVVIDRLAAALAGGASFEASGAFALEPQKFSGRIAAKGEDVRPLLALAGLRLATLPEGLGNFTISAEVEANQEEMILRDLALGIGDMRASGGVAVALRERPGFGVRLDFDRLEVEPLMALLATAEGAGDGQARASRSQAGDAAERALLDRFDANFELSAKALVWRERTFADASLRGALVGGAVTLEEARVGDIGGSALSLTGAIEGVSAAPSFSLALQALSADPARTLRLFGLNAPPSLGRMELKGSVEGDLNKFTLDTTLIALDGEARVSGTVESLLQGPAFDIAIAARHPDALALAAVFDPKLSPVDAGSSEFNLGGQGLGGLRLDGRIAGTSDETTVDITARIGDGIVTAKGGLSALAPAWAGEVTIAARHPSLALLAAALGRTRVGGVALGDLAPSLKGGIDLSGRVIFDPARVAIEKLEGVLGGTTLEGAFTLDLAGARPRLTGSLDAGDIALLSVLAPLGAGQGEGDRAPDAQADVPEAGAREVGAGGRWSSAPLDLAGLRSLDGALDITAETLRFEGLAMENARLSVTLEEGALRVAPFTGQVAGGSIAVTARVQATEAGADATFTARVSGVDAQGFLSAVKRARARVDGGVFDGVLGLVFPLAGGDVVSGRFDAALDLESRGESTSALVANLSGAGRIGLANAALAGVNACGLSKALETMDGIDSFLALIGAIRGGRTQIPELSAAFTIAGGIATFPPQRLRAECMEAGFEGVIDLAERTIDIEMRATLPAHEDFPGLVVEEIGPLDAPNIRLVNVNDIQAYVGGRVAQRIVRENVSRARPQAGEEPSQAKPPETPPDTQHDAQPETPAPQPETRAEPGPDGKAIDPFQKLIEGLVK